MQRPHSEFSSQQRFNYDRFATYSRLLNWSAQKIRFEQNLMISLVLILGKTEKQGEFAPADNAEKTQQDSIKKLSRSCMRYCDLALNKW